MLSSIICRRKFRSQTSDNMDRWKAEVGRAREEKRKRQKKEDAAARDPPRCVCDRGTGRLSSSKFTRPCCRHDTEEPKADLAWLWSKHMRLMILLRILTRIRFAEMDKTGCWCLVFTLYLNCKQSLNIIKPDPFHDKETAKKRQVLVPSCSIYAQKET